MLVARRCECARNTKELVGFAVFVELVREREPGGVGSDTEDERVAFVHDATRCGRVFTIEVS